MVANPIDRYGVGSLGDDMNYDDDGSLEILLQHEMPPAGATKNWIPTPDGPFNLFLRTYLPGPSFVEQDYVPPAVTRI
ncbi:DUF1214 domain-containing protein [Gordonia hankookensis]|uniref:DUF1214 domain-containing protein n=1 Tax=Gordonia hankookensis TaxID=589403 RepID=A0ABR7WD91_9ACTN|nr:DUF1214 domain-containing protein [Gordonia hankookensis]MBD1320610.1 DUF1214 domain-containing protein [Gordonia hankookensis]